MNLEIPLVDGEQIVDSEILSSENQKAAAIKCFIMGCVLIVIMVIFLDSDIVGSGLLGTTLLLFLFGITVLIVWGIYLWKYIAEYGLFLTNYRLIRQFTILNKPTIIEEYHYEFFETTTVPYYHPKKPLMGFILIAFGTVVIVVSLALESEDLFLNWYLGLIFAIIGLLIILLSRQKLLVIPFTIRLSSNHSLDFGFSVKKLGQERIYKLIYAILEQSRNFINKVSI